jgi:hypothetical protein
MTGTLRSYTTGERLRRAGLIARGARYALAGATDPGIDARIDRIDARAEDRREREAAALLRQHEQAKDDLTAAVATERAARGNDRTAARQARRKAEQRVRDTERAARRAGLSL